MGEHWEDAPLARDVPGGASPGAWPSRHAFCKIGGSCQSPDTPTRMAWGCQDVTWPSSLPAAGIGSQWTTQMDVLSILGSRSADQVGKLRNLEDSSGSLDLHPSLPDAPVQDLRGPTLPGAGTLDLKGAATARTGAVLSTSRHHV